jgi:hypothetical protein
MFGRAARFISQQLSGALMRFAISCMLLFVGLALPAHAHDDVWHGRIQVLSPTQDHTYRSVPLEVRIKITGFDHDGDKDDVFHVWLNGRSITRQLGPPVKNVYRVFLYNRNLLAGKNRLTVKTQGEEVKLSFDYRPKPASLLGSTSSQTYVPIRTQAHTTNGSVASVQVGTNNYPASQIGVPGFQVLVLDHQSLNLLSNTTHAVTGPTSWSAFNAFLKSPSLTQGCQEYGCLVVVQSLNSPGGFPTTDATNGIGFLGGTYELNTLLRYTNMNYSLITTVGVANSGNPEGTGHERMECAGTGACFGLGADGNARISGVLTLANHNTYSFANPNRVNFATGTNRNTNTIWNGVMVGGTTYGSDTLSSGGGFQLVVLNRTTLNLISNNTFTMSQLGQMANVINGPGTKGNMNQLFIVSSLGSIGKTVDPKGLPDWSAFASTLREIGGTYAVLDQLQPGDDYSLIGAFSDPNYGINPYPSWSGLYRFSPQEASSEISRAVQPINAPSLDSNIRGVLKRDHQEYFSVELANLTSSFNTTTAAMLDQLALTPPVPWPYPQTQDQLNAYTWLSNDSCQCQDIRAVYSGESASTLGSYQNHIDTAKYGDVNNPQFSSEDFSTMQTQLSTELNYAIAIQSYYKNLQSLYQDNEITLGSELTSDYTNIKNNLYVPPPPPGKSTFMKIFDITRGAVAIAGDLGGPASPAIKAGLDAYTLGVIVSEDIGDNSDGTPALNQQGELITTYGNLSQDAANNFQDQLYQLGNIFDLVLSDWGKLQALGQPLYSGQMQWDDSFTSEALGYYERSIRRQLLISLMAGVFSIEHEMPFGAGGPPPNRSGNWLPAETGPQYVSQAGEQVYPAQYGQVPFSTNYAQLWDGYALWNTPPIHLNGPTPDPVNSAVLIPFFSALDPNDPSKLGEYAPWFYTRDDDRIPRVCFDASGGLQYLFLPVNCPEQSLSTISDQFGHY